MMDEQTQYSYASFIIGKWMEVYELGENYRYNFLSNMVDYGISYAYISKLTRLWGELWIEIEGKADLKLTDGKPLKEEYEKYRIYYYDPRKILAGDIETAVKLADEIYNMEQIIRIAMNRLGYTQGS